MVSIDDVLREARKYAKTLNESRIRDAYHFAEQAHAGQTRMSGEAYISHPLAVALLLTRYKADENSLIAALLHDVVEDTKYSEKEVEKRFGKMVAKMVVALTKLPHTTPKNGSELQDFDSKIESIRKLFEVMQQDVRVLVMKLCDRLHNMSTLKHFRKEKQHRIAQETLDIYVKIADRLSIYELKEELEALSFQYLHPEEYAELQDQWKSTTDSFQRRKERLLDKMNDKKTLKKATDIVVRRSIPYAKWKGGDQLDIRTQVFIMLPRIEDCYLAYKDIHEIWKYKRSDMRDYISLPKSNGYQALQTSIVRRDGSLVTFIIQTPEMYRYGRNGVMTEAFNPSAEGKKIHLPWIEHLKKIHQKTKEKSGDYITALQNDILKGAIIIYTEDNKTLFLPPKSTLLDAAFYYMGRKAQFVQDVVVNDKSRAFSTYLNDGDNVKFLNASKTQINPDWLEMINTSYSKSTVFDLIKKMSSKKQLAYGQALLQKELHKRGLGYLQEIDASTVKKLLKEHEVTSLNEICIMVATGKLSKKNAIELLFRDQLKNERSKTMEYELDMQLLPHKYQSLSPFFNLFSDKDYNLIQFHIRSDNNEAMNIQASMSIPRTRYDSFMRSLRGLYDVRTFKLKESRRTLLGRWLLGLFMILVALDPVVAYYLINDVKLPYYDLLSIRFLTIFLTISLILFIKNRINHSIKESPINYLHRDFLFSVGSFFLTALFTYLSFDQQITPFAYQLSIYIILFPFFSVSQEKYPKRATLVFQLVCASMYISYIFYLNHYQNFDARLIIYALAAALSFTAYTYFSTQFQTKEHIERRTLSFFKTVSLCGAVFALVPYIFQKSYELPSPEQILYGVGFSILLITVPYLLYYMISGIYTFTSSVWKKFVTIVLMVKIAEWALLGIPLRSFELAIAFILIGAYWAFSKTLNKGDSSH
jgi:guanosine-3',5'-bis(diphosphate) 3'-pyrophosphohydrolase